MNNSLVKKNNTVLDKIKNFLKKFFCKSKHNTDYANQIEKKSSEIYSQNTDKNTFAESLKFNIDSSIYDTIKREELLDKIDENPDILYNMSLNELKKIREYYDESLNNLINT